MERPVVVTRRPRIWIAITSAALVVAFLVASFGVTRAATGVFIRVNQVGYLSDDAKVALVLSSESLAGATFSVRNVEGASVHSAAVGRDRGAYGGFAHLYEIDFSELRDDGRYRISLGETTSPVFSIGGDGYANVVATSLRFYQVQRCGDTSPALHGPCHLNPNSTASGRSVDLSGGWHDAGDYLKFLLTHGDTTLILLSAYSRNPGAFAGDGDVPPVLAEARVGLDWILKTWDPSRKILYYQVGDASDHESWRLPEGDDAASTPRPAFACESGKGANVAGKAAASLALAAVLWGDSSAPFYDPDLAARCRTAAEQLYKFGKSRPAAQPSTDGFYGERSWVDDMALAATELYRLTGEAKYLKNARKFARRAGPAYTFDWAELNALAHYELARVDESYKADAARALAEDLDAAVEASDANAFGIAVDPLNWGSGLSLSGAALEALWYEDLTGDATYREIARVQRDYELGMNPWGLSFVNGIGSAWYHRPHHQISDITGMELVGYWHEGPVRPAVFAGQEIELSGPDALAQFQSDEALSHDDVADYVTNEPTLVTNAAGIALASWYAAREK